MSFEHKIGSGSLFKNKFKKQDKHPDYRGDGKDLAGNPIEIAAWLKEDKNGQKYMSLSFSKPRQREQRQEQQTRDRSYDDAPF